MSSQQRGPGQRALAGPGAPQPPARVQIESGPGCAPPAAQRTADTPAQTPRRAQAHKPACAGAGPPRTPMCQPGAPPATQETPLEARFPQRTRRGFHRPSQTVQQSQTGAGYRPQGGGGQQLGCLATGRASAPGGWARRRHRHCAAGAAARGGGGDAAGGAPHRRGEASRAGRHRSACGGAAAAAATPLPQAPPGMPVASERAEATEAPPLEARMHPRLLQEAAVARRPSPRQP